MNRIILYPGLFYSKKYGPLNAFRASLVAQLVKNLLAIQESWVQSLHWEDPLKKKWEPTPVFSPGESNGQRNLEAYNP